VFSVREQGGEKGARGLPELVIRGLDAEHARLLLEGMIAGPLDEQVKARISTRRAAIARLDRSCHTA